MNKFLDLCKPNGLKLVEQLDVETQIVPMI